METIKTRIFTGQYDENDKKVYEAVNVEYNFGETLDDFVELCSPETTLSLAKSQAIVSIQGNVRRLSKAGKSAEEIQAEINSWKPGQVARRVAVDPQAAIVKQFATMSPEEQAEFLAKLGIDQ